MAKKIKKNRGDQLNHRPLEKIDAFVEKMKDRMLMDYDTSVDINSNQANTKDEIIKDKIKHNYEILKALEAEILTEEENRNKINMELEEQDIHEFKSQFDNIIEKGLKNEKRL